MRHNVALMLSKQKHPFGLTLRTVSSSEELDVLFRPDT